MTPPKYRTLVANPRCRLPMMRERCAIAGDYAVPKIGETLHADRFMMRLKAGRGRC
jgi:hypothetical protein